MTETASSLLTVEGPQASPEANPAFPIITLIEGHDFATVDYTQLFRAVQGALEERGLNNPYTLLTGYDAETDRESGIERQSTWAMPVGEVERAVGNPHLNHPFLYSRVRRPGGEPTVVAYDPSRLRRKDVEEPDEYVPIPGHTLASATLAEFKIHRIGDQE